MGVLYSAILLRPDIEIWFIFPAYIYGILYLFYSIYGMKSKNDNIGHTAHFGGAIGGYLLTLYIAPQLLVIEPLVVVLLASPIVMLFVLIKLKKI